MPRTLILLSVLSLAGCDDTIFSNGHKGGGGDGGADGGSTLSDESWCAVLQIIQADCLACHAATYPSGGLDLQTDPHAALVGVASPTYAGQTLVVAGDPDASFLVAKVSGTQTADQGGIMPPPDGLSSKRVEAIRAWISEGAPSTCDEPTDTGGTGSYHPEGYVDPSQHSMEAKLHEQTCTDCHGADLTGGAGLSCDTCHVPTWRTDCTFCHGGLDNSTGAPPESIRDEEVDTAFGAHTRHVEQNTHAAFDCTQCHVKPTSVTSSGHFLDSTPAEAEVTFTAGLSSAASWSSSAKSCSNLYCHGNGQGNNGSVTVADAPLSCDSCHPDQTSGRDAWDRMSGSHEDHLREGVTCQECHNDTTTNGTSIATPSLHVNGDPDIAFSGSGISRNSAGACTGTCHSVSHSYDTWD